MFHAHARGAPALVLSGQSNPFYMQDYVRSVSPWPVVQAVHGAEPIASWASSAPLWATLRTLLSPGRVRAFAWWQGESDGYNGMDTATYQAALSDLITRVRSAASMTTLPVIVVRIKGDTAFNSIRAAQSAFVAGDSHATLINIDDLAADAVGSPHLTTAGYQTAAARIVAAL